MIRSIEIIFPTLVELPDGFEQALNTLVNMVCLQYQRKHPDQVMWPAGHGAKLLRDPASLSDDEPIPLDESIYCIDVSCREDYYGENPNNPKRAELRAACQKFPPRYSRNAQRYEFMRRMMLEDRSPPTEFDIDLPEGAVPTEEQFDMAIDRWEKSCTP